MARKKSADCFDDARKYAGRNTAPNLGPVQEVKGITASRPFIKPPGGNDFKDTWVPKPGGEPWVPHPRKPQEKRTSK